MGELMKVKVAKVLYNEKTSSFCRAISRPVYDGPFIKVGQVVQVLTAKEIAAIAPYGFKKAKVRENNSDAVWVVTKENIPFEMLKKDLEPYIPNSWWLITEISFLWVGSGSSLIASIALQNIPLLIIGICGLLVSISICVK